jgi:hypothetical protein
MFDQLADTGLCSSVLRLDKTKRESLVVADDGHRQIPEFTLALRADGSFLAAPISFRIMNDVTTTSLERTFTQRSRTILWQSSAARSFRRMR